ncbi:MULTISPECIES: hypothetical protein [Marinomonas]|uniref:Uncharacterized protein n=1 Tax=Marinomonas arctica TaxID=383750 RepID=A0A7H1J3D0_9GAMM|nr:MULTISPECIES: hypothetical protein [Marinomonas]MCS7485969.1 hypothetical protein [Marinomonas sp. BSi20414]QNT04996.1 hypothetical protein IBG28_15025 [Marinomonas arctica]GGN16911.1 hypothetical protein GCM10011350_02320 [Marinomonas arctica]
MARQDNGIIDLSLPISEIEKALYDYAHSPLRGLKALHLALLSFQKNTQASLSDSLYHQRLVSLIAATEQLLVSGSPYVARYHKALLSSADALAQVAIAGQFGEGRAEPLYHLLLVERSCWQDVLSIINEETVLPSQVSYLARFNVRQAESVGVDAYLEALAGAGRVSFDLDAVQEGALKGLFRLTTAQSLDWLQRKYPQLQWQIASVNEDMSLRALCELSFLPIFQHSSMQRDARYRLLGAYEKTFERLFYQPFNRLFASDECILESPDRLVPMSNDNALIKLDDNAKCFPLRHGGAFYIGSCLPEQRHSEMTYLSRLGRDFLACFLYELDTSFGRFVFDREECLGTYTVTECDLRTHGALLLFSVAADVEAEVVLTACLLRSIETAFCLLPQYIDQVLVVRQGGQYFALPYFAICEVEGVCSVMSTPRAWVKNVWLSRENRPLIEPWLCRSDSLPAAISGSGKDNSLGFAKNGYYFGKVYGRMFWVEAELVLAILPYQKPFSAVHIDEDTFRSKSFIIHDGHCFDKVLSKDFVSDGFGPSGGKASFSMILDRMGESIVLPFWCCDWCESLPEARYVREFALPLEQFCYSAEKRHWMSLQEDAVIIDKKNFLSFVAGLSASLSLV